MTREEAIDIIKCLAWHRRPDEEDVEQAVKALEQQPCEDAISRQAAMDIVRHECGEWGGLAKEIIKQFNGLPPVQPKPIECEDTISRKDALKALDYDIKSFEFKSGVGRHMNEIANLLNTIYEIQSDNIKALPSVQPKPKTGHWIVHPKGIYAHLVCDKCLSNAPYDCHTNYCPNCGAKMIESQESEGKE